MPRLQIRTHLLVGFLLVAAVPFEARGVDYATDIKPLLAEKCYACHGALAQEASLRLETLELILRGGDTGPAISPGSADESLLIERIVADESERMPPAEHGSTMTEDQVSLLRRWIDAGAEAPQEPIPPAPSEHWAFQPVHRPNVPEFAGIENPIDAFLEQQRRERGIHSQPPADRSLQLRRLYLDLIGLPPNVHQLNDARPWPEIVDELLASPQHGERWGRHWMDIWRYCDWYGLGKQLRYSQKHLWRWRDWIVQSLNDDKGYDRMILEMIAGDELEPANPQVVVGTGYLARNYYLFNRTTWLDSTIEHTGKAFLGLTINCAKCHDHKYDPISQRDYYRMRAVFEPHQVRLDPVPGVIDLERDGLPRVFDDHPDAVTFLHRRGDPKDPDTDQPMEPGVPTILSRFAPPVQPVDLPAEAFAPGVREHVRDDHMRHLDDEIDNAEQSLARAREQWAAERADAEQTDAERTNEKRETTSQAEAWVDHFDELDPDRWQLIGDGWEHRDGTIIQSIASRDSSMLRLNVPVPRDFELKCTYTTTGGSTYRSVIVRFDQSEEANKYSNYVYTSAHAPGPKVQAAYERDGKSMYPAEARKARPIEIGRSYELRFAVRDTLVNVWLDNEFQFSYRFPDRADGFVSLSAFDATASFDSIEIKTLDPRQALRPANGSQPILDGKDAVALAEAKLKLAKLRRDSFFHAWTADRARWVDRVDQPRLAELSSKAARTQVQTEIAAADVEVLEAADEKALQAAKDRRASVVKRFDKLEAKTDPGEAFKYTSIRASRKALESPAHQESNYLPTYANTSTGRRLSLARWIVSRENPLTARVAVNHVWLRHFGKPLVESVFDFGLRTPRPRHGELLDYLAYEFMASGWSFRHLHRLMVTSEAYRLQSTTLQADEMVRLDPENSLHWRMNPRRMESQVVRDTLLSLAGKLDMTLGGPSLDPSQPSVRRSLYFQHSRDQQHKFLEMFDDADELQCYRRSESVVPQQALALSNSKLAIDMSAHIAARFSQRDEPTRRSAFIQVVFESLLGRSASDEELQTCEQFFERMSSFPESERLTESQIRARFVHAILNHNDFVTIR